MHIKIDNIGKIEHANIELNGITVIAGPNNSAKSTIGKVLYSTFNSFYQLDEQIEQDKSEIIIQIIEDQLKIKRDISYYLKTNRNEIESLVKAIQKQKDTYIENQTSLKDELIDLLIEYDYISHDEIALKDSVITETVKKITEVLQISDKRILKQVITNKIGAEFNHQINNIYRPETTGHIHLQIKDMDIKIAINNHSVTDLSHIYRLNTEVIYIDDPQVLDDQIPVASMDLIDPLNHRMHIRKKLAQQDEVNVVESLLIHDRFEKIHHKLNEICDGEIILNRGRYSFKKNDSDKTLYLRNISTGLKTFAMIKRLFENGSLEDNGTIILDEPEIHLHPEWQLALAEIIVLIQKEFGMHILLNTHSPYFLRAIEVYSANHGIADKCKYYLSENQGDISIFKDVTTQTDLIYKKLAYPLEKLQNEMHKND